MWYSIWKAGKLYCRTEAGLASRVHGCGLVMAQPLLGPYFLAASAVSLALSVGCTSSTTSIVDPSTEKCQFTVSNAPSSVGPAGGTGSVGITTARDCTWSVESGAGWVSLTAEPQG